jgi:hypothetical protein
MPAIANRHHRVWSTADRSRSRRTPSDVHLVVVRAGLMLAGVVLLATALISLDFLVAWLVTGRAY